MHGLLPLKDKKSAIQSGCHLAIRLRSSEFLVAITSASLSAPKVMSTQLERIIRMASLVWVMCIPMIFLNLSLVSKMLERGLIPSNVVTDTLLQNLLSEKSTLGAGTLMDSLAMEHLSQSFPRGKSS